MTNGEESINGTDYETVNDGIVHIMNSGLTKRELFLSRAMQGLCSYSHSRWACYHDENIQEITKDSVKYTNFLIEELNKPKQNG